jgi:polyphenol oxidase
MTTRAGGVSARPFNTFNLGAAVGDDPSAVAANRARLAATAGLGSDRIVWMRQVHGTVVRTVTSVAAAADAGQVREQADRRPPVIERLDEQLPPCDGIVTTVPGLALAVLVADCVPILAADPVAGVIAAVHAGRRGAADGIGPLAIERMVAAGATVEDIDVVLGPAICGTCYEVPAGMRAEVEATLPGSATTTCRGTPGLDLRVGLATQFRTLGVANVVIDPRCTHTDSDLFSHRRGAPTGRQAGLIWITR